MKLIHKKVLVLLNESITNIRCDTNRITKLDGCFSSYMYYDNIRDQIASIVVSIIKGHFFVDGNKRTALLVYILLSSLNKIKYITNQKEQVRVMVEIATSGRTIEYYSRLLFK